MGSDGGLLEGLPGVSTTQEHPDPTVPQPTSSSTTSGAPGTVPPDPADSTLPTETLGTPGIAPEVTAENPEAALADPSFFVAWLPELRTKPAPAWVQQGTRLTYYAAAASVPGSYHQYVEDEKGEWIDPTTGQRYRQEDVQSAAGHGYNEVNVSALNGGVAALSIRAYGLSGMARTSPVTTLTWGGAVGLPGAGSDYWLHPDVLAQVDEVITPSLKVLRMPYVIEGREYASIWMQSIGDRGNYTWVYDLESGALLHTASSTTGPPLVGPVAVGEGREGSTFLTHSTLVNIRRPALPWAEGAAPPWIGSINQIDYQGSFSVDVPGSPTIVLGCGLTVERRSSGTDWVRYLLARTMWSDVAPPVTEYAERVDGSALVGGIWIPPSGLAQLSAGQELDRDPVTQAVVSVTAVEPTGSGFTVTIRESGPGEVSDLVYDGENGLLVASSYVNLQLGTRINFQFAGWS
jgi:hypothetical protein